MSSPTQKAPPNSLDNRTMEQFLLELSLAEQYDEHAPKEVYNCDSCNGRCFEIFCTTINNMVKKRYCSAQCYKTFQAKQKQDEKDVPKPKSPPQANRDLVFLPFQNKSKPIPIPAYAKPKDKSKSHNKCLQEARAKANSQ